MHGHGARLVATGALALLALLAACSDEAGGDDDDGAGTATPQAPAPETAATTIEESGAPTEAARTVVDELRAAAVDGEDCGTIAADSGWPTTIMVGPDGAGCLIDALRSGTAARQTFTGRTGDGGALLTTYDVATDATVTVTRHVVSVDGEVTSTETTCSPPPTSWLIGIDGQIAERSGASFCRPASG